MNGWQAGWIDSFGGAPKMGQVARSFRRACLLREGHILPSPYLPLVTPVPIQRVVLPQQVLPYSRGMQTCFSSDDPEDLPIAFTIVVHGEDRLGSGTIWVFYPRRCHVESDFLVSPGMIVTLSLRLPGAAGVKIERGCVTWVSAL